MSGAVDYSREACEEAARFRQDDDEYAAALILALRAALDAAERERDEARGEASIYCDDMGFIVDQLEAVKTDRDAAAAMLRALLRERDEARQRIHDLDVVVDNWRGLLADAKAALATASPYAAKETPNDR